MSVETLPAELQNEYTFLTGGAKLSDMDMAASEQQREMVAANAGVVDDYKIVLTQVMGPLFSIAAPNWEVQPAEVDLLAEAYANALAYYFPDMKTAGPWVTVVLSTAAVIGPKVRKPRHKVKAAEEKPIAEEIVSHD